MSAVRRAHPPAAAGCGEIDLAPLLAMARHYFDVPVAAVRLIEPDRSWCVTVPEFDRSAFSGDNGFFGRTMSATSPFAVEDAREDVRFRRDRLVTAMPGIRFYAGAPLLVEAEHAIGVLSLFDTQSRRFNEGQLADFAGLARLVTAIIRNDRETDAIARMREELEQQTRIIRDQAEKIAHGKKIFDRASEVAKIGVWQCDLPSEELRWTDGVYDLFELPRGSPITRTQILKLYTPKALMEMEALRAKAIRERSGFNLDAEIITAKGNRRWMRLTCNVECEGDEPVRIFGMKQDITEEKALSERMRYLAEYDVLTGLANRSLFQARLARVDEAGSTLGALLLVDLDGFKQINDIFGHALGDECLKEVAARLRTICQEAELVARIGGDEFAVLIRSGTAAATLAALAQRIIDDLQRPIRSGDRLFMLGASVGFSTREQFARNSAADLFGAADLALYAAKRSGKNTFRVFAPDMKSEGDQRAEVTRTIARALADDELELYFQPKIHLADGGLAGFEALLRRMRADGSVETAETFAIAFDDLKLATRLGGRVIEKLLTQAELWQRASLDFGHIAFNVGAAQLRDQRFAEEFLAGITARGLRPGMFEVEISESVFLNDESQPVRKILKDLRRGGIRIALDDFGMGFASLVHLRTYPIDVIKIDKSFVARLLTSSPDRAIIEAILHIGASLGIEVVAEGIETIDQCDRLEALGCRIGQGFLFADALPAVAAERRFMAPALKMRA